MLQQYHKKELPGAWLKFCGIFINFFYYFLCLFFCFLIQANVVPFAKAADSAT